MSFSSVSRSITKLLFRLLFFIIFLVLLALAIFRFAPQAYVALANKFTPYTISSSDLKAELLPATLNFSDLAVVEELEDKTAVQVVSADNFLLKVDWVGFLSDDHNYWYGEIAGGQVNVQAFDTTPQEPDKTEETPMGPVNIHRLLSLLNLSVSDTEIILSDDTQLLISELNTDIGSEVRKLAANVEQNIQIALTYGERQKKLAVAGTLESRYKDGESRIDLKLDEVDLTDFFKETRDASEPELAASKVDTTEKPVQGPVDWSWLDLVEPTSLRLSVDKLLLDKNKLESLLMMVKVDESVTLESLQSLVEWQLGDDLWLKDKVDVSGTFAALENGNVDTTLSIAMADSQWTAQGEVDPISPLSSNIGLNLDVKTLPLFDKKGDLSELVSSNEQWLPLVSSLKVAPLSNDTQSSGLQIDVSSLNAGQSDAKGKVSVSGFAEQASPSSVLSIVANLDSDQFSYQSPAQEEPTEDKKSDKSKNQKLFSKDPIDWAWMSATQIDADVKVNKLIFDDRSFSNVNLPLRLDQEGLVVEEFKAELGDGAIQSSVKVSAPQAGLVNLDIKSKASGIVLNDLKLVDEKMLKGGDSRLDLSLTSKGVSAHDLASNLTGNALFHMKKAVIGNDAFELIGSDLIGELISKLNPFLKSDPTTDLKCAVVNLEFDKGKIDVDKSIAMETSKMILVVDGKIDLQKETLDLGIKPQATGGVGLDAGSLVKFLEVGGPLSSPRPKVSAGGLLKSGVAIGAALSTGGTSLLVDGLVSKVVTGKACERALSAADAK